MKNGKQSHIATEAQITRQMVSNYLNGRKNASAPIADRLAAITDTDIRVWLKGGDVTQRRAAVAAWAETPGPKPKAALEERSA